jgi:hypothetical protein
MADASASHELKILTQSSEDLPKDWGPRRG